MTFGAFHTLGHEGEIIRAALHFTEVIITGTVYEHLLFNGLQSENERTRILRVTYFFCQSSAEMTNICLFIYKQLFSLIKLEKY